jgi:hypothetical protein
MPTTIPYDPGLVLGNVVRPEYFGVLERIGAAQQPIDAAEQALNDLITLRRSLDMTSQELINLNVNPEKVQSKITELSEQIDVAATLYAGTCLENHSKVQQARGEILQVRHSVESPIDYNRTQIKRMPLAADSLRMNVQFFSMEDNDESAENHIRNIANFVSFSTGFLGNKFSAQMAGSVRRQVASQVKNHSIAGTLVISANCSHKDAVLLAPFVIDPDKAVRVWNAVCKPEKKIKMDGPTLARIAEEEGTDEEDVLRLISGATYGSSFVGMVHVLNKTHTETSQSMTATAASMQANFEVAAWFAKRSGSFGVDASMADDIKSLLSTQSVSSHVSLVTMGSIPSIKSNSVKLGVDRFADFSPDKMMEKLATLANSAIAEKSSVASAAEESRRGGEMAKLESQQIQSVMTGLAEIDYRDNKMLDINSLMVALDDYIDKALAGQIGVPINYYLKDITRAELAQLWVARYFPDQYLTIVPDEQRTDTGGGPQPATA